MFYYALAFLLVVILAGFFGFYVYADSSVDSNRENLPVVTFWDRLKFKH